MGFDAAYHALLKNHPFATWSTARLEGLNFTFPEVQTIMSGMTVGGHPCTIWTRCGPSRRRGAWWSGRRKNAPP
ncbi:hypothetical protein [Corynebacterium mastitidis]